MIALRLFFRLTLIEWTVILILIGGMLALELMNTAVEHTVDLFTKENHPLAKAQRTRQPGRFACLRRFVYDWVTYLFVKIVLMPALRRALFLQKFYICDLGVKKKPFLCKIKVSAGTITAIGRNTHID